MASPEPQHSDFRHWLFAQLRQSVPRLTEEWLGEVRRVSEPHTRSFPTELLFEQVASLLDRVLQALAVGENPVQDHDFCADVSALARFRWAHGYAKDELLAELSLLNKRVFQASSTLAQSYPSRVEAGVAFEVAVQLRNSLSALVDLTLCAFRDRDREDRRAWATLSSSFSRIAVHELRNRLNAAMLRAELTLSDSHDAQASIDAALNLVSEAVEDLARVAVAQSVQEPDHRTRPIEHLIDGVVEDLSPIANKAGVRVDALPPLPTFHIDTAKAYLVLVNLVGSAINHARASRPRAVVEIAAEALPARQAWRIDIVVRCPAGLRLPPEKVKRESPGVAAARTAAAQLGALLLVNADQRPEEPLFSLTVPEPPSDLLPIKPLQG